MITIAYIQDGEMVGSGGSFEKLPVGDELRRLWLDADNNDMIANEGTKFWQLAGELIHGRGVRLFWVEIFKKESAWQP